MLPAEDILRQALAAYRQGRPERAAELARRARAQGAPPQDTALLLGESLLAADRPQEARKVLADALREAPQDAQIERALGEAHLALGEIHTAIAHLQHAVGRRPDALAWHALARALQAAGDEQAACRAWGEALALDPRHLPSLEARARCRLAAGDSAKAVQDFRAALALAPRSVALHNGLAIALEAEGDFIAALHTLWPHRHLAQHHPQLANNLGLILQHLGMDENAEHWYGMAREGLPESPEVTWNLALCRLQRGDFAGGWPLFEARWSLPGFQTIRRDFPQPRWEGQALQGETVLLHAEQGLGDTLQFARLAQRVAERGGHVILEIQPTLVTLLQRLEGVSQVIPYGAPLPPFQYHCPLMSLPLALGLTLEDLPAATLPYLTPPPDRLEYWRNRLPRDDRPRVGIVWAGNPRHHDPATRRIDRRRSLPLNALLPLLRRRDIHWISLQRDQARQSAQATLARLGVHDLGEELRDFADTAAVVQQLDLLITVDTAIAHLAGALHRPTWVLTRFDACWRWLRHREDSPWYPSLRLYRQPTPGDWGHVIRRIDQDLAGLPPTW